MKITSNYTAYNKPQFKLNVKQDKKENVAFGNANVFSKTDKFMFKLANKRFMQKMVEWAAGKTKKLNKDGKVTSVIRNENKLNQFLMVGYSLLLQTNYVANVLNNDRMPKKRKQTLAINNIVSFFIPAIGAFTVDRAINKGIKRLQLYIIKANKEVGKTIKPSSSTISGVRAAASILVFTMMYKYGSTVIATPIADKITKFMDKKGWLSNEEAPHKQVTYKPVK